MRKRSVYIFLNVILCVILAGTAVTDLSERKVYNLWLIPGFLTGLALRGSGFLFSVIFMFFPVYFLFRIKAMGAGDGKVIMLTAGSLGLHDASFAIFLGFLIAAVLSIFYIINEKGKTIPLAACLAGGAVPFILIRIFMCIEGV